MFYSVGLNELTEPFYPLGVAQHARALANPAYAGPDYRARAVMLVGGDYTAGTVVLAPGKTLASGCVLRVETS